VYAGFKQLKPHLDHLRALAPQPPLEFISIDSKDGVRAALSNVDSPADVLYFYTHGSLHLGAPCLIVGADERIKYVDLDAWDVRLDHHPPLVVLNACDSADYSPESFENLLKFFCDRGAAGVIGTQCEIKETLADFVSIAFFRAFFLQQASAGQALLEARRALLRDHLDPRGLAYSLFASADLKLAQSID
jgi:CHAT domain-containing protein